MNTAAVPSRVQLGGHRVPASAVAAAPLRVLDLFSGAAGGWSLGLHRAGLVTIAACEIDPWRRAVFSRNNPCARMYDDVCALTAERLWADGCGSIDVLAGSPPCQDASTANTSGKGIDGARTGLFWEAIRLVRELRPRWVLLENVPGLRTRGYDRVHAALEEAGYAVRPLVVGAWHAGAPHRRNRVWIIANAPAVRGSAIEGHQPDGDRQRAAADAEKSAKRSRSDIAFAESKIGTPRPADEARLEIERGQPGDDEPQCAPLERAIEERCGALAEGWNGGIAGRLRMDDGLPKGVARAALAAYGDAVVPAITEIIGRAIIACELPAPTPLLPRAGTTGGTRRAIPGAASFMQVLT